MYVTPNSKPRITEMMRRVKLYDAVRQYKLTKRLLRNLACVVLLAARLRPNVSSGSEGDGRVTPSEFRLH